MICGSERTADKVTIAAAHALLDVEESCREDQMCGFRSWSRVYAGFWVGEHQWGGR